MNSPRRFWLWSVVSVSSVLLIALVTLNMMFSNPVPALSAPLVHASGEIHALQESDPVTITITEDGLEPAGVTATVGSEVVWYNATDAPRSLSVELDVLYNLYLPLLLRNVDNTTVAGQTPTSDGVQVSNSYVAGSLNVQIPSGGSYTHSYNVLGRFSYLLDVGNLLGDVLVVPQNTREITFDPSNGTLTIRVNNVSLLDILDVLQRGFGLKVVVPELQDAPVTADFQGVPLDPGLAQIIAPMGARFHYAAAGAEFQTNLGSQGSRGQPVDDPYPGGNPPKGEGPDPGDDDLKPSPDPDPDPTPIGDDLKPAPENSIDLPPGTGPKDPVGEFYELDHPRFSFTYVNGDIEPQYGTTLESGYVHNERLAGRFIYAVRIDGDLEFVGSMPDPLEVAVHGGPGHEHRGSIADEAMFNLPLPSDLFYTATYTDTNIEFYRLQQPLSVQATDPLTQVLTPSTFGQYQPHLTALDTVTGGELVDVYQPPTAIVSANADLLNDADVTALLRSGGTGEKKNLVIIGDGFQSDDQDDFNSFVDSYVMEGVFENGVLRETMNAFNIFRVNVDSNDQGVTQVDSDGDVTDEKDTALDYEYSGDWDRCWMEPGSDTSSNLRSILNDAVPQWDYVFIVLNESSGGGCRRGSQAAVTVSNPNGWATGSHELAHMVGNLGDEYFGSGTYTGGEPSAVNLTKETDRSDIKWNAYIDPRTPIPTTCGDVTDNTGDVGLFEGATIGTTKYDTDLYRPSCTGRLRSSGRDHNPVGHTQMHEMVEPQHDYTYRNSYVGDFDGDGRDDLVLHNANSLALYLSTGSALELEWIVTGELPGWDDFKSGDTFFVGDFNGDGRDDLYVFNVSDWVIPYFAMLRSTGSGFELVRRFDQKLPGWDDMRWRDEFFVADFNADGMDDIVVFNGSDWSVGYLQLLRSTGTDLSYVKRYDQKLPGWDDMRKYDQFYIGDFNNDSRDDIYVFNGWDWSIGYLQMLRSTGTSLSYVKRFDEELPGWDDMKPNDQFFVGDFNEDNLDDLYVFNGRDWSMGYLQMLRSTGTDLNYVIRYDREVPGWDDLMPNDRFYVADVDGDGDDDLYVYNASDWVTEYLGILTSSGTTLSGRWQDDWINSWNLGYFDDFEVANFNGGGGWDDLFVHNRDWFGLLRSHKTSTVLNAIYPRWIVNHNYHKHGWW